MILKDHGSRSSRRWGVYRASSPANEAGFGSIAVRPNVALSGAGGAGAAGLRPPEAAPPEVLRASRRAPFCRRTAADSHAEKSGCGAGGAGAAPRRPRQSRQTAASQQTCVMWSEQFERESQEDPMCRWRRRRQARVARLTNFSPFILHLI